MGAIERAAKGGVQVNNDPKVTRSGRALELIDTAGLSRYAAIIVREANQKAGDDHKLFFRLVEENIKAIQEHEKREPEPSPDTGKIAAYLDKMTPQQTQKILSIMVDIHRMMRQGWSDDEIASYLLRIYGSRV